MARLFGYYVSLEMALLCLLELFVSFLVFYLALVSTAVIDASAHSAGVDVAAMLAGTIACTGVAIGLYRPQIFLQWRRLLVTVAIAGLLTFPVALIVSQTLKVPLNAYYVAWIVKVLLAWIACMVLTRWLFGLAMRERVFARPLIVVGSGPRATRLSEKVRAQASPFFELVAMIDPLTAAEQIEPAAAGRSAGAPRGIWGVVVATDPNQALPAGDLLSCKLKGIRILDDIRFMEQHLGRIDLDNISPDWMVFADGFAFSRWESGLKRASDLAISSAILLTTLPLMLVTALLIKLDSRGPVFYRQERVGLHGRSFNVLKFRSMKVDAEKEGTPRWATQRDSRVTRVGTFIRATRIDELPQLLNVLRGEMSFVGPRPERPHFVEQLEQVIPFYRERSYVKPGITGWAQVNYPYGASVEDAREKLAYDLYYVKNRSLFLDLLILVSTVRVILFQEGAR